MSKEPGCHCWLVQQWMGQPRLKTLLGKTSSGTRRRSGTRRGISLLEVLISMFVMMIGLMGVASLLPAGRFSVVEGSKLDRAAAIGRAAVRDLKVRGMLQPQQGFDSSGNPISRWMKADKTPIDTQAGIPIDPGSAASPTHLYSYAIDPWSIAVNGTAANQFPDVNTSITGAAVMQRITLRAGTDILSLAMSEEIARSRDDLKFDLPKNTDKSALQFFDRDGSKNATKRQWAGDYSWLATVSPNPHATVSPNPPYDGRGQWTVSIVVFHKRPIQLPTNPLTAAANDPSPPERMVNVLFLGGGDVLLSTDSTAANAKHYLDVRRGEWLMLGEIKDFSGAKVPTFRWYKIISADDTVAAQSPAPSGSKLMRYVTLEGADWDATLPTTASLFDGTIGVFEKNLKLETTSMWSN